MCAGGEERDALGDPMRWASGSPGRIESLAGRTPRVESHYGCGRLSFMETVPQLQGRNICGAEAKGKRAEEGDELYGTVNRVVVEKLCGLRCVR